ncbi:MAG: class I SAM-dependent methyltransferase, partial [Planctomycetes bacterium]|nr:class I SAM-dependent methyltransferase [Planctomycetota bacterium]
LDDEATRRHYDGIVGHRSRLYRERFDDDLLENRPIVARMFERAFARLYPLRVGSMLDVGCGTALYFPILCRHADRLEGIDGSAAMIRRAEANLATRGLANCRVHVGSATRLPFADRSFDAVNSWDFLHHVGNLEGTLAEIRRVLKPGGRYVAVEPNLLNPSIAWYHARRRSEWRLFARNQFTIPRRLEAAFDTLIGYDNTVISFVDARTEWLWRVADGLTSLPPLRWLAFRYVVECHLRDGHDVQAP